MVREAERRRKKFEAKVDAEVLARQTTALKPLMVRGQALYFPDIATVEEKVKTLVEAEGVSTLEVRDYLNFGREIYRLSKRFSSVTLSAEAQTRVDKWSARGLTGSRLVKIAQLFGVTPTVAPTPPTLPPWVLSLEEEWYTILAGENLFQLTILDFEGGTGRNWASHCSWYFSAEAPDFWYECARTFGWARGRYPLKIIGESLSTELDKEYAMLDYAIWKGKAEQTIFVDRHVIDPIPIRTADFTFDHSDNPILIPRDWFFYISAYIYIESSAPPAPNDLKIKDLFIKTKVAE